MRAASVRTQPAAAHRRSPREPGDERRPGGRNPASGTAGSRRKRQGRRGDARPGRREEHTRHNRQTAREPGEDGNRAKPGITASRSRPPEAATGTGARLRAEQNGEAAGTGRATTHPERPISTTPAAPRRSSRRAGRRRDLKRERPPGRAQRGTQRGREEQEQAARPSAATARAAAPRPRERIKSLPFPAGKQRSPPPVTAGHHTRAIKTGPRGTADGQRPRRRKRGRGRPAAGKG